MAFASEAEPIAAWSFPDGAGTGVKALTGQPARLRWNENVAGVAATGNGALRIRTMGEGASFVPLKGLAKDDETLWIVVRLNAWKFYGQGDEQLRLGFTQNASDRQAPIVVQLRFSRTAKGLHVAGEAFKDTEGASHVANTRLGAAASDGKVTIALEFVRSKNVYRIYRHEGGDSFRLLGSGKTSPRRQPNFLRLHVRGDFASAEDEFLDVGSITLMAAPPPAA